MQNQVKANLGMSFSENAFFYLEKVQNFHQKREKTTQCILIFTKFIDFYNMLDKISVEIYKKLGKKCQSWEIFQVEKWKKIEIAVFSGLRKTNARHKCPTQKRSSLSWVWGEKHDHQRCHTAEIFLSPQK